MGTAPYGLVSCSRHQRSKILKANHNLPYNIRIEKELFTTSKIENFESKSQPLRVYCTADYCCSRHQRSKILKANHNSVSFQHYVFAVVHDIKDRKFWKQITTLCTFPFWLSSCSRHQRSKILKANHNWLSSRWCCNMVVHDIKDRKFWKQITTDGTRSFYFDRLFTTSKIENFESKSQRAAKTAWDVQCCSRHQRSKILKANHNNKSFGNNW